MSPMVPFITEHVWQELIKPVEADAAASIHLTSWPEVEESLIDLTLRDQVALTRRIVELGRAARAESSVRFANHWAVHLSRLMVGQICQAICAIRLQTN
jgi:isoleucyl-tRNA synthetase